MADDTTPVTESDLAAAVANIDFFLVRLQGLLGLKDKMKSLSSLLAAEREKRATLGELDRQAATVKEMVATGHVAQARLDRVQTEIDQHLSTAKAEGDRILTESHATAARIVATANNDAAQILAEARATAATEAEQHAAAVGEKKAEAARLGGEISARRAELARVNQVIAEARDRLGA